MGNKKPYDLGERTKLFAKEVIAYQNTLSRTLANAEIRKQLIRSVGSVGANYIEANESFSKKDFILRIKICRKEAKESCYWLELLEVSSNDAEKTRDGLIQEANELLRIFNAIIEKQK
ncbi:MAG: four helix bundle protein [Dehalococcoidales bacterium]|nr:four helix bundle protein [Dehalococcoidales bacterium]